MSRIAKTFQQLQAQKAKALIPYIMAGDPDPGATLSIMHELVRNGADVIELGMPFSDPMADGPVIQRAAERALAQGMNLQKVLDTVKAFRLTDTQTPVVLMGYANPIERYELLHGAGQFAKNASASGVDGVLVVDYPPEESYEFAKALKLHHIDQIFLLAPTSTDERIERVGELATGYVYYVSLKGVTGAATLDTASVALVLPRLQKAVKVPVCVGFGIRDTQGAKAVASVCDGVVVGSRLIELMETQEHDQAIKMVGTWMDELRQALNSL